MKKGLLFILSLLLMAVSLSFFNVDNVKTYDAAVGTTPSVRYSSTLSSSYYNSVSSKSGDDLLEGLASLTLANHKYYTTYEETKGGCVYSDKDPNNSSKFIDFYTGWSVPNDWDGGTTWNREHVWAQSLTNGLFGTTGAGSDIHHIRPLISSINSARNNGLFTDTEHCGSITLEKYYYTGTKVPSYTGKWTGCYTYNQDYWEPRDTEKGDIARILMYLYMHYSKEVSANASHSYAGALSITNIAYTSSKTASAAWKMLVGWSDLDPVSTFEMNRNNYCASVTGVRNPFIDHPEYANSIWGNGTSSGSGSSSSGSSGGSTSSGTTSGDSSSSGSSTTITQTETVYRQLKSANGITVGSKIIIAAKDYNYAMSTNQKTDNRGYTTISKYTSGSDNYLTPSSTTEIIEVKGKSGDAYSLYTSKGYLAATSSTANELTSKSSVGSGKNAYWNINFSSGAAKIVSAGSYTRNTIRYNSTSKLFSCYAADNTQKDVVIYKQYTETTTIVVPLPDTGGSGSSSGTTDSNYEYPTANTMLSISKAIEVANAAGTSFTSDKYQIQGTITSIESTTYGNMTIQDENGDSIYVYGVYSEDGLTRYDALTNQPQVGDKITLLGILGLYDTTIEMKSGWIVNLEKPHQHSVEIKYDEENHQEVCKECNEVISTEPHNFSKSEVNPTCESDGKVTYTCNCGYSYSEIIKSTGHSYDNGVVTKEPTTLEEGEKTYTCSKCGHTTIEKIDKIVIESEEPTNKPTTPEEPNVDIPDIQNLIEQLSSLSVKTNLGLHYYKNDNNFTLSDVRLSWKVTIPEELYKLLTIEKAGFECGIDREGTSVKVLDCTNKIGIDENGDYYILGSINIPKSEASTHINVKAFFTINGEKVYLNQVSHSLQSLVKIYMDGINGLTNLHIEILNALIDAYDIVI